MRNVGVYLSSMTSIINPAHEALRTLEEGGQMFCRPSSWDEQRTVPASTQKPVVRSGTLGGSSVPDGASNQVKLPLQILEVRQIWRGREDAILQQR